MPPATWCFPAAARCKYVGGAASSNRLFTVGSGGGVIDASGSGPVNFSNTGAAAISTAGPVTLALVGSGAGTNNLSASIANGVGGTTSLLKGGAGAWQLSGSSSYTGSTSINGGQPVVEQYQPGGRGAGAVSINNGATLAGIGSVAGQTFVNSGFVSPGLGGAFGTLTFSNTSRLHAQRQLHPGFCRQRH